MILIKCSPVCDHGGNTIAQSDDTGLYNVYAEHGWVAGEFKSVNDAKKFIDSFGGKIDVRMKAQENAIDLREVLKDK